MGLRAPKLDDRSFAQLVAAAREHIRRACPEWNDLSPHDPGSVLIEAFAHITETMLHRLNRVPERMYVEFLKLIGVQLLPPTAAAVELTFSLAQQAQARLEIPRGTAVSAARGEAGAPAVVFTTARAVTFEPGAQRVRVQAHHLQWVEAERLGVGTGQPGLTLRVGHPPIVTTHAGADLVLGVELAADEPIDRLDMRVHAGKRYRVWSEVDSFADAAPDQCVYMLDRVSGRVLFAPAASADGAALAAYPPASREIRAWYARGGGANGNVAAGVLSSHKLAVPGLTVTNSQPATGGRDPERIEHALVRGPTELRSLQRAVTARDYELLAVRHGAVARARVWTAAELWAHAIAGTVMVVVVPAVPEAVRGSQNEQLSLATLEAYAHTETQTRIDAMLEEQRPLGMRCEVSFARYKVASVKARVFAAPDADPEALRARLVRCLHELVSPLPSRLQPTGWEFGRALRASQVYELLLSVEGVRYVEAVRLVVEDSPVEVRSLAADYFQARTFYAASGDRVFRSLDGGSGWEPVARFAGESVELIRAHPRIAGLVAVSTLLAGEARRQHLRLSLTCGESFVPELPSLDGVEDIGWIESDEPKLLVATAQGLFEFTPGQPPVRLTVDPTRLTLALWAVATFTDANGDTLVAVAARDEGGVYVSRAGGKSGSFEPAGLVGSDVRSLHVQRYAGRAFLWAAVAAVGNEEGKGCYRAEWLGADKPLDQWKLLSKDYRGGSVLALTFAGSLALCGTHRAGVLRMETATAGELAWRTPPLTESGLPLREEHRLFQPVTALAITPEAALALNRGQTTILAAGPLGIVRGTNAERFEPSSARERSDHVPLPPTWLFCSGQHDIEVVVDHAG